MRTGLNSVLVTLSAAFLSVPAMAGVIYDSIPGSLPPDVPSWGYQANQTAEFGNRIDFGGALRQLTNVNVLLSDAAAALTYGSLDPTWSYGITFNIYQVDNSTSTPQPGAVIASRTQTFDIPWRPEPDGICGTGYRAVNGNCYNGVAFVVTFDFTGTVVPDEVIYGVAFNTQTYGAAPTGRPGPYNSLNFGLVTTDPSVGANPLPGSVYWNTTSANYSGGGPGGTFRADSNWLDAGAVSFEVVPEPGTFLLFATGFLLIGTNFLRKSVAPFSR